MPIIPDLQSPQGRFDPATPDIRTAMAPGMAMARVGAGIGDVGEAMGNIGEKLGEARDNGVKNLARMEMQQAYADHQQFRLENPDETTWGPDVEKRSADAWARIQKNPMSRYMREELQTTFQGWSAGFASGVKYDATKQTQAVARQRYSNASKAYRQTGNFNDALVLADEAVAANVLSPVEAEADKVSIAGEIPDWELKQSIEAEKQKIAADPITWKTSGQKHSDPVVQQQLTSYANQVIAQDQREIVESVREGMASGDVNTPAQIDELAAHGSYFTREILKGELLDRNDTKVKAMRAMPEYQNKVVGVVAERLAKLDPEDSDQSLQVDSLIGQLPPGAVKNHYAQELARILKGEPEEESALAFNLKMADDVFKSGWFGRSVQKQSLEASIADGFLTDSWPKGKLQSLGLTPTEANTVASAKGTAKKPSAAANETARKEAFQKLWKPDKAPPGVDPFILATAKAIRDGKSGDVKYQSPADYWRERETYGRVKQHIIRWSKIHPKSSAEEIRREMINFASPGKQDDFMNAVFSGAGFDDEPTPAVLPPTSGLDRFADDPLQVAPGPGGSTDLLLPSKP